MTSLPSPQLSSKMSPCWDALKRSIWEPQPVAARGGAEVTSPHSLSSSMPGVVGGWGLVRRGSLPDRLACRASCLHRLLAVKTAQCEQVPESSA